MTETKLAFCPELYRRYWLNRMRIIYGISGIINLVLLWQMFFDIPDTVLTGQIPLSVWNGPLLLLMLINTAVFAGYSTHRYSKFKKLRESSYITLLTDGAVVHFIQEPFMSSETARMAAEGKLKRADAMEFYAAYLKFRITKVTKLRYNRFGAIILEGAVERTYHDEYLQIEEGNGYTVMTVSKHKIPAYYKDMDAIYSALEMLKTPEIIRNGSTP